MSTGLELMVINAPKKKVKLNRIQIFILYFFIFAFLGWLMETLYAIYNLGHFTKRGFLYGPICPIYGFGALDALFSMHWWDYTNEFFNLNGRISIFYSFAWGIIAIIFINHIYPFLKKRVNLILSKIPYRLQLCIVYVFTAIWGVDTVLSFIRYLT